MDLNTNVEQLSAVGKTVAKRLARLNIKTARDLLYYFPFRYEDYRDIVKIKDLRDKQTATVRAKVDFISNKRSWKKKRIITEALVSDDTGSMRVVWFGQPFITKNLDSGQDVFLSGKIKEDMLGSQMVGPAYEKATATMPDHGKNRLETVHTARLIPIYPLTANITQKQIRFLVSQVIGLSDKIDEWLDRSILEHADLIPIGHAIRGIHFPIDENDFKQSSDRLKFDELFHLQLKAQISRREKSKLKANPLAFKEKQIKNFVKSLPFTLTKPQKISSWEILQDLGRSVPMNRLLSGDVGSGKTVVAVMAILNTVLNNSQAVLMAPTEILAVQHYKSVSNLLGKSHTIGLYTQSEIELDNRKLPVTKSARKKQFLSLLKSGDIKICIGTHALLSETVDFKKLGLVIVDEQHRFGVEQRKTIKEKHKGAHFLSMTATPIPRSLALLFYGDLDISIINELPPGRRPIITRVVELKNRNKAYDFIAKQIKCGRQIFVVCPLIEEKIIDNCSEDYDSTAYGDLSVYGEKKTVMNEYKKLSEKIFPNFKINYLHGKMKPIDKQKAMDEFKNHLIDILVSTSVVEVGVDIPNASVMMVEGAERFGLAQLHQFRGRVGRSSHQSYNFLFMEKSSEKAVRRLDYFEKNSDGFKLAEKDLQMRGPGEVFGFQQSGKMNLRLARLTDRDIIKKARDCARLVMDNQGKYKMLIRSLLGSEKQAVHFE
ncbi:MAG: ATP-dependent DNA helicase RecG [bacterium]